MDVSRINQHVVIQGLRLREVDIRMQAIEAVCEEEFATLHRELDRIEQHVGLRETEQTTLRVIQ